jgi:AcrR family transcriptional regulator
VLDSTSAVRNIVTPSFRLVKFFFMSTSSRERILDGALELIRGGGTVSLASAARQVGLTKPGVMYHFPTKEALMLALVDRVMDGWDAQMARRLPGPPEQVPAEERLRAYLDWCLSGEVDETDLVMLTDQRLRATLKERWVARVEPWVDLPADLPPERRSRLLAVRLLADGVWFADAAGVFAPDPQERARVRAVADELLEG